MAHQYAVEKTQEVIRLCKEWNKGTYVFLFLLEDVGPELIFIVKPFESQFWIDFDGAIIIFLSENLDKDFNLRLLQSKITQADSFVKNFKFYTK